MSWFINCFGYVSGRQLQWKPAMGGGGCFRAEAHPAETTSGLGVKPPALEDFVFYEQNNLILGLKNYRAKNLFS